MKKKTGLKPEQKQFHDETMFLGSGGDSFQLAQEGTPQLTTQAGTPVQMIRTH